MTSSLAHKVGEIMLIIHESYFNINFFEMENILGKYIFSKHVREILQHSSNIINVVFIFIAYSLDFPS